MQKVLVGEIVVDDEVPGMGGDVEEVGGESGEVDMGYGEEEDYGEEEGLEEFDEEDYGEEGAD